MYYNEIYRYLTKDKKFPFKKRLKELKNLRKKLANSLIRVNKVYSLTGPTSYVKENLKRIYYLAESLADNNLLFEYWLSKLYLELNTGDMIIANKSLDELANLEKILSPKQLVRLWHLRGNAYLYMGKLVLARECCLKSIELINKYNLTLNSLVKAEIMIGVTFLFETQLNKALKYLKKGLADSRKINHITFVIYTLAKLGSVYSKLSNYKQAEKYFKESLKLAQKIGYHKGVVEAKVYYTSFYICKKKYKQAEDLLLSVEILAKENNNLDALNAIWENLYSIYFAMENYQDAWYYKIKSYYASRQFNRINYIVFSLMNLIGILFVKEKYTNLIYLSKYTYNLFQKAQIEEILFNYWYYLSFSYLKLQKKELSLKCAYKMMSFSPDVSDDTAIEAYWHLYKLISDS